MRSKRDIHQRLAEETRAMEAMDTLDPDASDETIAEIVAYSHRGTWHISIIHDTRPRELHKRARNPNYCPSERIGPCPLPYDWIRKNVVGISTRDRDQARQWIIKATLAGYCVYHQITRNGSGGGRGTSAQIRAKRREAARIVAGPIKG